MRLNVNLYYISELTRNNNHTGAALYIIRHIGNQYENADMEEISYCHNAVGNISPDLIEQRTLVLKQALDRLRWQGDQGKRWAEAIWCRL